MLSYLIALSIQVFNPVVTQKYYNAGDCSYIRSELCTPPNYGVYCDDGTYHELTRSMYYRTRIGDNCPA